MYEAAAVSLSSIIQEACNHTSPEPKNFGFHILEAEAGVDKPINKHLIAFSAVTLLVWHQN